MEIKEEEKFRIPALKNIKIFEVIDCKGSKKFYINDSIDKAKEKIINKYQNKNVKIKYIYSTDNLDTAKKMAVKFPELK